MPLGLAFPEVKMARRLQVLRQQAQRQVASDKSNTGIQLGKLSSTTPATRTRLSRAGQVSRLTKSFFAICLGQMSIDEVSVGTKDIINRFVPGIRVLIPSVA